MLDKQIEMYQDLCLEVHECAEKFVGSLPRLEINWEEFVFFGQSRVSTKEVDKVNLEPLIKELEEKVDKMENYLK